MFLEFLTLWKLLVLLFGIEVSGEVTTMFGFMFLNVAQEHTSKDC